MRDLTADTLNAVLLPLCDERLLLPSLAIADAIAPSTLRPAADGAPDWFAGWIVWQDIDLPVLRFERLNGGRHDSSGRRARIAVLRALSAGAGGPRFGLICDGHPQLMSLGRDGIEALPLRAVDLPALVLARVRLDGRDAVIPDLAAIEQRLAAALESGVAIGRALEPEAADPSVRGTGV